MRFPRLWIPLAVLTVVLALPTATAVTITATAPTDPLPFDGTLTIDVDVAATCSEIMQDGVETLPLKAQASVDWIEASGSDIPWTSDQCDPSSVSGIPGCTTPECAQGYPTASSSGTITLTPSDIAPALEVAEITITLGEKEGSFTFPIQVSHYVTFNATSDRTAVKAGLAERQPLNVSLDVSTNAVSTATFNVTQAPSHGTLRGLDNVAITPNVATLFEHHAGFFVWSDGGPDAGKPISLVVPIQYESAATVWTPDTATIEVRLFADKDPTKMSDPVTLTWNFEPTVTEQPDGGNAPGIDFVAFALVGGTILLIRNRRRSA